MNCGNFYSVLKETLKCWMRFNCPFNSIRACRSLPKHTLTIFKFILYGTKGHAGWLYKWLVCGWCNLDSQTHTRGGISWIYYSDCRLGQCSMQYCEKRLVVLSLDIATTTPHFGIFFTSLTIVPAGTLLDLGIIWLAKRCTCMCPGRHLIGHGIYCLASVHLMYTSQALYPILHCSRVLIEPMSTLHSAAYNFLYRR